MKDIFGAKASTRDFVWDDDPFATDDLMQVNNRFATITANDEYEDYVNPDTWRRNTTRAPLLFKILDNHADLAGGPLDNDAELNQLAMNHGTSPDLAKQYNAAGRSDRDLIAQGVGTALEWGATATRVQLAAQRKAAEKVNAYKLAGRAPTLGVDYTDFGGLSAYEAEAFFNGTPEARQAIAGKLNAEMQPWNAPNETPAHDVHAPRMKVAQHVAREADYDSAPGELFPQARRAELPPIDTKPYTPPAFADLDYVYEILEELFPSKGLMKNIAIAESLEGRHPKTARPGYHGGVFQVDRGAFRETQIQPGLKRQRDIVSNFINRGWSKVSWDELRTSPLLSGLAARLYLLRLTEAIPKDIPEQAVYWKDHYNSSVGEGNPQKFLQRLKEHKR